MSRLTEATNEAQEAIRHAIDASDEDICMWDACCDDGVPAGAEQRHNRLKLALALLDPPTPSKIAQLLSAPLYATPPTPSGEAETIQTQAAGEKAIYLLTNYANGKTVAARSVDHRLLRSAASDILASHTAQGERIDALVQAQTAMFGRLVAEEENVSTLSTRLAESEAREGALTKLATEYRPTMDREVVHSWAQDVVSALTLKGGR